MKRMAFLDNPRGRRAGRRKSGKRKAVRARKRRVVVKVSKRRASPGRAVPRRHSPGGSMARKKGRGRAARKGRKGGALVIVNRHHSARRHGRSRARRNPPIMSLFSPRNVGTFAMNAGIDAVEALGGMIAVRKVRGMFGKAPGTVTSALIEGGVAIAGGLALSAVNRNLGARFAQGGLMAPLATFVSRMAIPGLSDALGDDGFAMVGDMSAYVEGVGDGADTNVGRYLSGGMGQGDREYQGDYAFVQ